jgi:hypothetical protein
MINIEQLRFPSGIAGRPLREQQWTRGARLQGQKTRPQRVLRANPMAVCTERITYEPGGRGFKSCRARQFPQ